MVVQFKQLLICSIMICALAFCSCAEKQESNELPGPSSQDGERVVIYQLVMRLFSNVKGVNEFDGDLVTNGVGKFDQINDNALDALLDLGVTHIWLTGVIQQATNTDYSYLDPPQPADDPDILKGKAGSFFAIKDYFDVCPDYALDPQNRMAEFEDLVARIHEKGLKVLIDLVPNHVARTYDSEQSPENNFGADDDTSVFFSSQNNFFYLVDPAGQVLQLPEPEHWTRPEGADGTLETENNDGNPPGDVPKATGNNQTSAAPTLNDWYETIKLNYGFDFTTFESSYTPTPNTWEKMDAVLEFWQSKGVDGFRCDFAHWVPIEAWTYLVSNARSRNSDVFFMAEAYESGDAPPGFSFSNMIKAGFDAVYDDATYDALKGIFCCGRWANDIDALLPDDFLSAHFLRYAENHDERRIASPIVTGDNSDDSGLGSYQAGMPVAGLLYLLNTGPILIYNGQEVGEEGAGAEGFGGEDGRTSIFDYWTMPYMAQWVNFHEYDGGQLDEGRKGLRQWYKDIIALSKQPGFSSGNFYSIQYVNRDNWRYSSGQYVYSFLRYDNDAGARWLVIANFVNTGHEFDVLIPKDALVNMGFDVENDTLRFYDAFDENKAPKAVDAKNAHNKGIEIQLDPYELQVYRIE